jgi:hypothetical protein
LIDHGKLYNNIFYGLVREDPDNHSNEANVKNALMLKCINSAGQLKNRIQSFAAPDQAF